MFDIEEDSRGDGRLAFRQEFCFTGCEGWGSTAEGLCTLPGDLDCLFSFFSCSHDVYVIL